MILMVSKKNIGQIQSSFISNDTNIHPLISYVLLPGEEMNEDSLNASVSEFIKTKSATIKYKKVGYTSIQMQRAKNGQKVDMHDFPIDASTTVQDICQMDRQRVLRIKNGNICSVVPPDTKLSSLVDDGFEYRHDEYKPESCTSNEKQEVYLKRQFSLIFFFSNLTISF